MCRIAALTIFTFNLNDMRKPKMLLVTVATACLTLMGLASPVPASAAEIGTGPALIRIDATKGTVSKNSDGSFTLKIPSNSKGQYLGERVSAQGKERIRVGNVSARQLSSQWKDFQYGSAGAKATIAWNSNAEAWSGVPVRVYKPSITTSGISFKFTSDRGIPAKLKDVSVNLQRAPIKQTRTSYDPQAKVDLTGDLYFFAGFYNEDNVDTHVMDNDSNCWSYKFTSFKTETISNGKCAGVEYSDGSTTWGDVPPECSGCFPPSGQSQVSLKITLQPSGQDSFTYQNVIISISDVW